MGLSAKPACRQAGADRQKSGTIEKIKEPLFLSLKFALFFYYLVE